MQLSKAVGVALILLATTSCGPSDFERARTEQFAGNYRRAEGLLLDFLKAKGRSRKAPEALWDLGRLYRVHLNDPKRALEAYSLLVKSFPKHDKAKQAQQEIPEIYRINFGDHRQAIPEYLKVVQNANYEMDERAQALYQVGNSYLALNNFEQAQLEFKRLLKEYPKASSAASAALQIAHTYMVAEDYEAGRKEYERILQAHKDQSKVMQDAKFGLAQALVEVELYEEAMTLYQELLSSYPSKRVIEIRIAKLNERLAKQGSRRRKAKKES